MRKNVVPVFLDNPVQVINGSGSINKDSSRVELNPSQNSEAVTLSDGSVYGQIVSVVNKSTEGYSVVVTPDNPNPNQSATITLNGEGDVANLIWDGSIWTLIYKSGESSTWRGYPILTSENQTLYSPPSSTLSNYIFSVESSGFHGGDATDWSNFINGNPDKSNIWVMDVSSDPYNPVVFSWTPPTSDVSDFINANEIVVNGNDIYVVYMWSGAPELGESSHHADNKVVKFTNCSVNSGTSSISYSTAEVVTCTGQGSIHGVTRDKDYIWMISRARSSEVIDPAFETRLGRVNLSGPLQYDGYDIIDADPEWFGSDFSGSYDQFEGVDTFSGEQISNYGDYLYFRAIAYNEGNGLGNVVTRVSKTDKQAENWLQIDPAMLYDVTEVFPLPLESQGKIITIYDRATNDEIESQSVSNNSEWETLSSNWKTITQGLLDTASGQQYFGFVNSIALHAAYIDQSSETIIISSESSPIVATYDIGADSWEVFIIDGASATQAPVGFAPNTTKYSSGFTDDFAFKSGYVYLGSEGTDKGLWVLRLSDGSYQRLATLTHSPFGVTQADMVI